MVTCSAPCPTTFAKFSSAQEHPTERDTCPSEKKTNDLWGADRFEKTPVSETLQASCRPVSAGAALLINMLVVCPSNGSMTGKWKRPSGIRPQNPNVEKLIRGLV